MAKLRILKSIAGGLAGSFASRNNDSGGYWALGKLNTLATRRGTDHLRIAIKPSGSEDPDPLLMGISARYGSMLARLLNASRLPEDSVREGYIDTFFEVDASMLGLVRKHLRFKNVRCSVTLIDRNGRAHSQESFTACHRHIPWLESRSTRREGE